MKVTELIEKLLTCPQDITVVVSGYEGGVTEVKECLVRRVRLSKHDKSEWYYGEHEPIAPYEEETSGDASVLLISGKRH